MSTLTDKLKHPKELESRELETKELETKAPEELIIPTKLSKLSEPIGYTNPLGKRPVLSDGSIMKSSNGVYTPVTDSEISVCNRFVDKGWFIPVT